jgi:NADPH:quinone reductase-like Zn-dependent oxidoreductase
MLARETMRAVVSSEYGSPDVAQLREVDPPVPGRGEVRIRVRATTVSRTDCGMRRAEPFFARLFTGLLRPKTTILGLDLAGDVDAVGDGVEAFAVGDAVFGLSPERYGAHADHLCLPETAPIAAKPANLSYAEAAALGEGFWYAITNLREAELRSGQRILVYGASGAIGTAAVQLAKVLGAEVTAVCNTRNVALVGSLGADLVIDYTRDDFTRAGDAAYDVVFDAVGKTSFFRCRRLLKPGGRYLATDLGFLWQNPFLVLLTKLAGTKRVRFPLPKSPRADVVYVKELAEAGKIRPVIDRRYPLEQIREAYRYVETGEKTGAVVIEVAGS